MKSYRGEEEERHLTGEGRKRCQQLLMGKGKDLSREKKYSVGKDGGKVYMGRRESLKQNSK